MLCASCRDFLDVQSDSQFSEAYVYSSKGELDYVLNSVYASLLSSHLYGEKYLNHYAFNSDVEFTSFSGMTRNTGGNDFRCFDGEAHSGDAANTWKDAYQGVERANLLIYGIETSPIYDENDDELMQMLGEGKTLRAMLMHDLVVHFGDVPFPRVPTFHREEGIIPPVEDRSATLTWLINDLKSIAPKMKYANELKDGVERASREFCFAMIARMALTRGGYSLRPDKGNPFAVGTMQREADYKDYYEIARDFADSVISSNTHSLTKSFVAVFVDECNYIVTNDDDPIFEIPFAKHQSGSIGYRFGPRGEVNDDRITTSSNVWGESAGGQRLNALYRYSFDTTDVRRDVSVGLWGYRFNGAPFIIAGNSLTNYANKWSKFWAEPGNTMGVESQGNTGINFPYMRYADVLLMYAEAVNEAEDGVNGTNGTKAKEALKEVRRRAFPTSLHGSKVDQYVSDVSTAKDTFFMAIFNERKWEFGGENLRWKDLVRWNLYSKVVYETFMDIYTVGCMKNGEYLDGYEKWEKLPSIFYFLTAGVDNPKDINKYQNKTLNVLQIQTTAPSLNSNWSYPARFDWGTPDGVYPRAECCYSLRGYIRGGDYANYTLFNRNNLPPVRYILPMPRQVIIMSKGGEGYTNYYGY